MKISRWSTLAVLLLCLITPAMAGDKGRKETKPGDAKAKAAMHEKAMMDAWMKAATPGEPHKKLEPFIGTFDVKVKSWMQPGAPAMESTGTSEQNWVLGGRYVEQRFKGSFMEQPFEGLGYTGYDNIKKQYVGTWMDNMSTAVMMSTGKADASGKQMNFKGTSPDPMTGKDMSMTSKITVADNNHHTMEMWGPAPNGKIFKMMEIQYVRKN